MSLGTRCKRAPVQLAAIYLLKDKLRLKTEIYKFLALNYITVMKVTINTLQSRPTSIVSAKFFLERVVKIK